MATRKTEKLNIPIKLTPEQKAKIKEITGNNLSILHLKLEWFERGESPKLFIPGNPV
jgi:hypothetical protein